MIHSAALSVRPDPRNPLAPAGRVRLLAWLLFAFASLALAEKAAEASDDFLEYLGSMENDDDNWSDIAQPSAQDDKAATHSHQSSSAASEQSSDAASNHSTSARSGK